MIYICVTLLVLLAISIFLNVKHIRFIFSVEDAVEKSLDVLDEQYAKVSEILDIPVMHDSQQIKDVIRSIGVSRDAILEVANIMTLAEESEEEDDDT